MYSVSTLVFPLMFYVLFGLVMGKQTIGNISTTVYLIPAYGTFGVMGASLFGTAAGLALRTRVGLVAGEARQPDADFCILFGEGRDEPDFQHD